MKPEIKNQQPTTIESRTFRCRDTEPDGKTPCPFASTNSRCDGDCKHTIAALAKIETILRGD